MKTKKIIVSYILSGLCGKENAQINGQREFTKDRDCEKFLQRLANLKLALAFRCAGLTFNKLSDAFGPASKLSSDYGNRKMKSSAIEASNQNTYKLTVNIQTV